MQLQLQNFSTLVSNAAAAVQGAATQLLDLTVGSTLRAVLEANASLALWLQWLILQVLQMTRAATSTGPDLDTWMADFSVTRLPAVAAAGTVTFSRFAPVSSALIPIGTDVRTGDGTQTFTVYADPTNAAYTAAQNGYLIAAGIGSLDVPAVAVTAGSAGNVQAGAVSLIVAALPGADTVVNAAPFQGGLDAESDAALRARFQNFLASLSRATTTAVGYAITSIQQGMQYTIQENLVPGGAARMGSFIITVDDGTGDPPPDLLTTVATAVEAVRPVGSSYAVQAVTVTTATISLTVAVAPGAVHATVAPLVSAAVAGYVDLLPIGATLPWSRLAQVAYDASPQVANVTAVLLNGGTADLTPPLSGVIKAAAPVTVN
jgi:phage-related baseplate assembly protein